MSLLQCTETLKQKKRKETLLTISVVVRRIKKCCNLDAKEVIAKIFAMEVEKVKPNTV